MRGKRRKISWRDRTVRRVGGVADRHWTDPRDGVGWTLWLEIAGDRPALVFGSEGDTHTGLGGLRRGALGSVE